MNHHLRTTIPVFSLVGIVLTMASFAVAEVVIEKADDAILYTEALKTTKEKVDYLIFQGQKFMKDKKYSEAKKIAEHILAKLDERSEEAKQLLADAKVKMEEEVPKVNPIKIKF